MLLLFNKIGMVYKSKNVVIEVVKNSYKGSFITEGYFLFFDNLKAFCEIFSFKVYFVNYIIPILI